MASEFGTLREPVEHLVDALAARLPEKELRFIRLCSTAGEWAEAVEDLCAVLVLDQISVNAKERDALAAVLERLGPQDDDDFPYINRKASTIAALNVEPKAR